MSCKAPIPPEDLLSNDDPALIEATLNQVDDVQVIQDYASYENTHEKRLGVLEMLQSRAAEIRQNE